MGLEDMVKDIAAASSSKTLLESYLPMVAEHAEQHGRPADVPAVMARAAEKSNAIRISSEQFGVIGQAKPRFVWNRFDAHGLMEYVFEVPRENGGGGELFRIYLNEDGRFQTMAGEVLCDMNDPLTTTRTLCAMFLTEILESARFEATPES